MGADYGGWWTAGEAAQQGREAEIQPGSWLRSPQLTCSQLLNSSAMASSLISCGKWIFGSLRLTLASLYLCLPPLLRRLACLGLECGT